MEQKIASYRQWGLGGGGGGGGGGGQVPHWIFKVTQTILYNTHQL